MDEMNKKDSGRVGVSSSDYALMVYLLIPRKKKRKARSSCSPRGFLKRSGITSGDRTTA